MKGNGSGLNLVALLALLACCGFPLLAVLFASLFQSERIGYVVYVVLGFGALLAVVYLFRKRVR